MTTRPLLIAPVLLLLAGILPAAAQDSPSSAIAAKGSSLWQVVVEGTLGSLPVMIPLALLSVAALALAIYLLITYTKSRIITDRYLAAAADLLRKSDYGAVVTLSERSPELTAQVIGKAAEFARENPEADYSAIREIAQTEGSLCATRLDQNVSYLSEIAAIAPLLGLLGTVIGMIKSFNVIAVETVNRPMLVASGVSVALITTAAGIIVAVPCLAAYAHFRARSQNLAAELESASTQLLTIMSLSHRKSPPPAATTAPRTPAYQESDLF